MAFLELSVHGELRAEAITGAGRGPSSCSLLSSPASSPGSVPPPPPMLQVLTFSKGCSRSRFKDTRSPWMLASGTSSFVMHCGQGSMCSSPGLPRPAGQGPGAQDPQHPQGSRPLRFRPRPPLLEPGAAPTCRTQAGSPNLVGEPWPLALRHFLRVPPPFPAAASGPLHQTVATGRTALPPRVQSAVGRVSGPACGRCALLGCLPLACLSAWKPREPEAGVSGRGPRTAPAPPRNSAPFTQRR